MSINDRPETTLFLPISVDGRVTSHDSDEMDPNKAWKRDPKVRARLQQFYEFSQGPIHTVTSGKTLAESGVNVRTGKPKKLAVSLIVLDEEGELTTAGIKYVGLSVKKVYLVTLKKHAVTKMKALPKNVVHLKYDKEIDLVDLMKRMKKKYKVKQITIQSNAKLNARWLSAGLVDHLSVIISPLLVGVYGTPALIDQELLKVKPLILTDYRDFGLGMVNLRYDVMND